jgi:formylglycine-generating enzyme required for sulfatase activity
MRLFVSYARIDKPFCLQIVETLDVHEIWYDQRLYAGQRWWPEIQRRLNWCEGFVYLLSPDSVASKYCRDEYQMALQLGKHIFPVLIHDPTPIPDDLIQVHYADMSKGKTPDAVKLLLSSIYLAEKQDEPPLPLLDSSKSPDPTEINPATIFGEAVHALALGNFDQAVFLLKLALEKGYKSRFIDVQGLLEEAEAALVRQTLSRDMERDYKHIAALVTRRPTRKLGCAALRAFSEMYPEHDPDNLARFCEGEDASAQAVEARSRAKSDFSLPLLEWCDIPAGMTTVDIAGHNGHARQRTFHVPSFRISKYAVTNAQYQFFVDDPDGYANSNWWNYSSHAREWRGKTPQPKPSRFKGHDRPRESITWYEAVAFCNWLSTKLGQAICLPTEQQWQRAAQGDDGRLYPWGDDFDRNRCNTRESRIRMTTLVMRYPGGVSPYGVYDMAGNVWEWCLNTVAGDENSTDITLSGDRAVHGGSFIGIHHRAQAPFHFYLSPLYFYATIGFRIVAACEAVS